MSTPTKILRVTGKFGSYGEDGATFVPSVSDDGTLSWSNNKGLENPVPTNIKGNNGASPYVGENGNWWIGETDTGVTARGETGADGYTPVKGTDYWTEEDKTEIVNEVLAALPTWAGGEY